MIELFMARQPLFSNLSLVQMSPNLNVTLTNNAEGFVLTGEHLSLEFYSTFLFEPRSDFDDLFQDSHLRQGHLTMFGKTVLEPRETAWYGDAGRSYQYSNKRMNPHAWESSKAGLILLELKNRIEDLTQAKFSSVLVNHYRNGHDSVGWHSDDEPELGSEPFIASVSLGAERRFDLRLKSDHSKVVQCRLPHGSLIIMKNQTQRYWQHQIPKQRNVVEARVNLTYRMISNLSKA